MIWLKRIGKGIAAVFALFGVFVLAGFLLPSEFTAGTELDIDAPPPDVFEVFNSQAGIQQW